jgi:hypothetical protein
MAKYETLEREIFSIFNSTTWKAENIKTGPANFLMMNAGTEFIRVSVIPNGRATNINSVSGILIIDIFIPSGNGPSRASIIADKLDMYLAGKSLATNSGTNTQFLNSSLTAKGIDKDNASLFVSSYTIPFNHFGVF